MSDNGEWYEFSVVSFHDDGHHRYIARFVGGQEAVNVAKLATEIADLSGANRIIITDGGDHTVFQWEQGKGVTYPTPEMREAHGKG
jgi:hypothetical protein